MLTFAVYLYDESHKCALVVFQNSNGLCVCVCVDVHMFDDKRQTVIKDDEEKTRRIYFIQANRQKI